MVLQRPGFTNAVDGAKLVDCERNWKNIAQAFAALTAYEREYERKLEEFERRAEDAANKVQEAREKLNDIREKTWRAEERARRAEDRAREAEKNARSAELRKNVMEDIRMSRRATALGIRQREWDDFQPGEIRVTIDGESMNLKQLYCANVLEQRWY